MITHRSMLRFSCRSGLLDRAVRVFGPRSETSSAADQSLKFLSQIPQVHGVRVTKVSNAGSVARDFLEGTHFVEAKCFSNREAIDLSIQVFGTTQEKKIFGTRELVSGLEGLKGSSYLHSNSEAVAKLNVVPQLLGNLVKKVHVSVCPTTLSLRSFIHSSSQKEFETTERNSRSMNFVRGIIDGDRRNDMGGSQFPQYGVEHNANIVHVKLMRNNTFVTVTDSKGNKKIGASSGMLSEMKGGPKLSRYAAEATAEHIGRLARNMGLNTFVVKVNGFTYFKKKRQAILSFREGYTHSRGDQNPIVYIEDTTRKAHNGCRLPKKRRV